MQRWAWVGIGMTALGCAGARPVTPPQPSAAAQRDTSARAAVAAALDEAKSRAALDEAKSRAAQANQLFAAQRYAEARAATEQGIARLAPGALDADRVRYQLEMIRAESFRYENNPSEAVPAFRAALEAASRHERELRGQTLEAILRLSATLDGLERVPEAISWLERGLMIAQADAQTSEQTIRVASALASAYERGGRTDRAKEVLSRYVSAARLLDAKSGELSDIQALLVYNTPPLAPRRPRLRRPRLRRPRLRRPRRRGPAR